MRDNETIIGEACALAEKSGRAVYVFAGRHGLRRDARAPTIIPYTECTAWGEAIPRAAGYIPAPSILPPNAFACRREPGLLPSASDAPLVAMPPSASRAPSVPPLVTMPPSASRRHEPGAPPPRTVFGKMPRETLPPRVFGKRPAPHVAAPSPATEGASVADLIAATRAQGREQAAREHARAIDGAC
jgi:hypothetical protein